MAKAISVTQVSNFDIHGDVSSLSIRWEDWVDSFEIYAAASGVDSGVQKRALLLHCAGKEVQELFKTFGDTGTTYDAAREKLDAHFKPKKNISYGYMSIRPSTITSQYHYVPVPLRPSTIASQYHWVPVPLRPSAIMSQYNYVPLRPRTIRSQY
ncbi:hypothetical protein V1264_010179 [Littorina saxatilis]|uniref:Uncharacterized protein n=1 Tax=Littorina saxatilis TaxID=31220 RepID=A0AAN9ANQ4_9CAEN